MPEATTPATPANFAAKVAATPAPTAPAQPAAPANTQALGNMHQAPAQSPASNNQQAPAANDNAQQGQPTANDNGQQQQQQATEWWQETLPGDVSARDLVEAYKRGELPEAAAGHIKRVMKVNGRELSVPLSEAERSYMRLTDYTQGKMAIAQEQAQLNDAKAKISEFFKGWDSDEGYAQSMQALGLVSKAQALVTKNWGNAEKPNVPGFLDDMRRLGHFGTFRAAAQAYAEDFARRMQLFNPTGHPEYQNQAVQLFEQWEREQDSMWGARIAAERQTEDMRREQSKRQREMLLAQQQQQAPQVDMQQLTAQVNSIRDQAFAEAGITANQSPKERQTTLRYFGENMDALIRIAASEGFAEPVESLVQKAAQATLIDLQASGANFTPQPNQNPSGLPARPGAAPTTGPGAPRGGSASDFESKFRGGGMAIR